MISLNSLPSCVLLRVLSYVIGPGSTSLQDWIPKLRLLHVCGLWTDILKPSILTEAFIYIDLGLLTFYRRMSDNHVVLVCRTNTDIIIERAYHPHVVYLNISANVDIYSKTFYTCLFSALKPDICEWSGILQLKLNISQSYGTSDPKPYIDMSTNQTILDLLYKSIPRVRLLDVYQNPPGGNLSSILTAHYLPYLTNVDILVSSIQRHTYFCRQLTSLILTFDTTSMLLQGPFIYTKTLLQLRLIQLPSALSWTRLFMADGLEVCFDSLEYLVVEFQYGDLSTDVSSATSNNKALVAKKKSLPTIYKYVFPVLKTLDITNCPKGSELHNARFGLLEVVILRNSPCNLSHLLKTSTMTLKRLDVIFDNFDKNTADISNDFCNVLKSVNSKNVNKLTLLSLPEHFDSMSSRWSNLTSLVITKSLNISLIAPLISNITSLSTFEAFSLRNSSHIANPEYTTIEYLSLLLETPTISIEGLKIANIRLYYSSLTDLCDELQLLSILGIVVQFGTVKTLYIKPSLEVFVEKFLDALLTVYKHLSGLQINYESSFISEHSNSKQVYLSLGT